MKPLNALRRARVLLFGPSGHGKTHLLGSLSDDPRTSPCLFLDYEGGVSTLIGKDFVEAEVANDLRNYSGKSSVVFSVRSWEDFSAAYQAITDAPNSFKSIAMDSGTEAQLMALLLRLEDTTRRRSNANALDENDYGIVLTQMRRLFREFRNLPYHFFVSALAKEDTDVREGKVKKPSFVGSFLDEAPGMFECVAYLALSEDRDENGEPKTTRVLVLQNYPKIRAKVRMPDGMTAPDEIVNPTMGALLDVLGIE